MSLNYHLIIFLFLDKQVQYPSLDGLHNFAKSRLKPTINSDLSDNKSKLNHINNYSSEEEEELDAQELNQTEPPMFDRSTKV